MEIDGTDAFAHVFDRALDLAVEVDRQRYKTSEKDAEIARLKREIDDIKREIDDTGRISVKTAIALSKLWKEANKAAAPNSDLRKIVDETAVLADEIPF